MFIFHSPLHPQNQSQLTSKVHASDYSALNSGLNAVGIKTQTSAITKVV